MLEYTQGLSDHIDPFIMRIQVAYLDMWVIYHIFNKRQNIIAELNYLYVFFARSDSTAALFSIFSMIIYDFI